MPYVPDYFPHSSTLCMRDTFLTPIMPGFISAHTMCEDFADDLLRKLDAPIVQEHIEDFADALLRQHEANDRGPYRRELSRQISESIPDLAQDLTLEDLQFC
jgi:hypothetical protein